MAKRLLIVLFLLISATSYSSHIVGGEFELTYLCPNKYQLNLVLYYDEINSLSPTLTDQDVYAHIFRISDNKLMQVIFLPKIRDEEVPYYQDWCDGGEVQTLRIIYGDTLTMSDEDYSDPDGYYVAWENCCRNYDVTNVVTGSVPNSENTSPGAANLSSGQTYYLQFPPIVRDGQPFINSTPVDFPALSSYACINRAFWADFSGVDPDGDSLVYSITLPFDVKRPGYSPDSTRPRPYREVVWEEGFGPTVIMGGDPDLTITTGGFISVTPKIVGLFIFAVKIEEYRDGVRIGTIQREFQMFVDDLCEKQFAPKIESKATASAAYEEVPLLEVNYTSAVSAEDRCISIRITDKDTQSEIEQIFIKAIALNFEEELEGLIPQDSVFELTTGQSIDFDICFPACPFIDPLISDVATIGLIVFDDACPLPLIDTLRIEVRMEPPVNQVPSIVIDGNQPDEISHSVTQTAGGVLTFPIEGYDPDNQHMQMEILPVGEFDYSLPGMSFSEPSDEPGKISTVFRWEYDCGNNALDFSEGTSIPITNGTRKLYEFLILVEDMDQCEFARADTLHMSLAIDFPGEFAPNVFLANENENENYFLFNFNLSEKIEFDVKALDGQGDNDNINLFAIGGNYHMDSLGAKFPVIASGPGTSPGTQSTFTWQLWCDLFALVEQDTFRTYFIAQDVDACQLANTDTVTVDIVLNTGENDNPELHIESLPGEEPVINNSISTDFSKRIRFDLVGSDPNQDSLVIRLLYVNGTKPISDFKFQETKGWSQVKANFEMDLGCEKLGDGFTQATYQFAFIVEDLSCAQVGSDTLDFHLTVTDISIDDNDFLPANIFTPNGDGINDYFAMAAFDEQREERNILPLDNCIGQFKSVTIINRYGKEVYFNLDRDFKWFAQDSPAGVYYYIIRYTDKTYKGTVTAMY